MPWNPMIGLPGIGTTVTATPREILAGNSQFAQYIPGGRIVSGAAARDPGNINDIGVLRAGMLLGKITASGKYAPSVIGPTTAALGGAQTTLTTSAATAVEVARRLGTSGTLKLAGPAVAGGTTRTFTVTYSAVNTTTGAITVTATAAGAVSAVNQINSLVTVDNTGVGTFTITVEGITTAAITYSATIATLITNINAQLNATFGTSAIAASGASLAALILTFSGTGYSGRPVGAVTVNILVNAGGTTFTINGVGTVGTSSVSPVTTAGVVAVAADEGEFISGSFIGPIDGSAAPITIVGDDYGLKVTDIAGNSTDVYLDRALLIGFVRTASIVNYPTDTSLIAWVKSQLRTYCPALSFDDDF